MNIAQSLHRAARKIGIKNKYAEREIKKDGVLRAAVIDNEGEALNRAEKTKRFTEWKRVQGY